MLGMPAERWLRWERTLDHGEALSGLLHTFHRNKANAHKVNSLLGSSTYKPLLWRLRLPKTTKRSAFDSHCMCKNTAVKTKIAVVLRAQGDVWKCYHHANASPLWHCVYVCCAFKYPGGAYLFPFIPLKVKTSGGERSQISPVRPERPKASWKPPSLRRYILTTITLPHFKRFVISASLCLLRVDWRSTVVWGATEATSSKTVLYY